MLVRLCEPVCGDVDDGDEDGEGRGGSLNLKTVDPLNFLDECVLVVCS